MRLFTCLLAEVVDVFVSAPALLAVAVVMTVPLVEEIGAFASALDIVLTLFRTV